MMRVIVVVIVLLAPPGVFGNTVYIQPGPEIGQDTYGCDYDPYETHGDLGWMVAGHDMYNYNAFLCFTQLDEYIGYEITSAHLSIEIIVDYPSVWRFHRVLEPWDEDTLTWANQPDHSDSEYCSGSASVDDFYMTVDVTWMVQNWVDEEWENFGWCIKGGWSLVIYTSESGCVCPMLYLTGPDLPPVGVQPTSLGKIKTLFSPQLEYSGGGGRIGRPAPHRSWLMGLRG